MLEMKFKKNPLLAILPYAITFIIFILLFLNINFYNVLEVLKETSLIFLSIAVFLQLINLILYADKLRNAAKLWGLNLQFRKALFLNLSSFPIRVLMPMRAGELVQALYFKKMKNFPLKKGIMVVLTMAIFDFFALFFYISLGFIFLRLNISEFGTWKLILFIIIFLTLLFILIIKKTYFSKICKTFEALLNKLKQVNFIKIVYLFFNSVVWYLLTLLTCSLVFKALNISIPFTEIIFFIPLVFILTKIPITISGFGAREALIIYFFSGYAAAESLFSAGLLISFVLHIIPSIIGIFFQKELFKNISK